MTFSPSEVLPIAESTGFRAEMIEKVLHLINLLDMLNRHPMLQGKWVLKGGTALNLFVFDLPRLSVDIDLNYIGTLDREAMLTDRPKVEQAAHAVFSREGYITKRVPGEHAGGKWRLSYQSYTGQSGNLEVDLNFMFRLPLWDIQITDSNVLGDFQAKGIALELTRLLIPTLNKRFMEKQGPPAGYGESLVKDCRAKLEAVLPFTDAEREFLDLLLEKGEIDASFLTPDKAFQKRIQNQPLLQWKALNLKRHKGLD